MLLKESVVTTVSKRTDIQDKDLLQVAMALLPSDIDEGTKLKWENLVYTIID